MTSPSTLLPPPPAQVPMPRVEVAEFYEGEIVTAVKVTLDNVVPGGVLVAEGTAKLHPGEREKRCLEVGRALAVGRALRDLGNDLISAAEYAVAGPATWNSEQHQVELTGDPSFDFSEGEE